MPNPPRLPTPPHVVAAIEAELLNPQDPPRSRRALSAAHGVSVRTVQRIADRLGIAKDAWRTDTVRAATESALDRRRAERSRIADELQRRAAEILAKLDEPFLAFAFGGRDNEYNEHLLPGPPTSDIRNLVQSANTLLGRAQEIDTRDQAGADDSAGEVLDRLFTGLGHAYRAARLDDDTDQGEPAP